LQTKASARKKQQQYEYDILYSKVKNSQSKSKLDVPGIVELSC
jgi:hypothetical protein